MVVLGTRRPCLFPAVNRPIIRVPAIDVWITGIVSPRAASNTLQELFLSVFVCGNYL